jgi:radical SAM protein with 4Fe4S-binding SPASM domain
MRQAHSSLVAPGPPDVLSVEVTNVCNLTCTMCARTLSAVNVGRPRGLLTEHAWAEVVKVAPRVATISLNGLSENLLHPRFLDLVREIDETGAGIVFSTNGTLITPEVAARIAGFRGIRALNISIDSADPEEYRRIRGGTLERVREGMENLVAATRGSLHVTASAVVMKSGRRGLPLLPAFLKSAGVENLVLQAAVDPERKLPDHELPPDAPEAIAEVRREIARLGMSVLVVPYLETRLRGAERPTAEPPQGPPAPGRTKMCTAPWEHIAVDWQGRVFPCCSSPSWQNLVAEDELVLGNLSHQSFSDIWHGPKSRRFRQGLLEGRLPTVCRRCPLVSEGTHPFVRVAAEVVFEHARPTRSGVLIVVRNTGTEVWTADTRLKVAPTRPRDRTSALHTRHWPSSHRASTMREVRVTPGQLATFAVPLAPSSPGTTERFQVLAEGLCWLPNTEFEVRALRPLLPFWPLGPTRYSIEPLEDQPPRPIGPVRRPATTEPPPRALPAS